MRYGEAGDQAETFERAEPGTTEAEVRAFQKAEESERVLEEAETVAHKQHRVFEEQ